MMDLLNLKPYVFKLYFIFFSQHYHRFIDLNGFVMDRKHSDNVISKKFMERFDFFFEISYIKDDTIFLNDD